MRTIVDAAVKIAVVLSLVLAATSVSYYFIVYLPGRDATLDAARGAEAARLKQEAEQKAAQAAAEKERREGSERAAVELHKILVQARYDNCIKSASSNYNLIWDGYCKRREEQRRKDYQQCSTNGVSPKATCDGLYGQSIPDHDCSLVAAIADKLNGQLEQSKTRCFQELQAGLE